MFSLSLPCSIHITNINTTHVIILIGIMPLKCTLIFNNQKHLSTCPSITQFVPPPHIFCSMLLPPLEVFVTEIQVTDQRTHQHHTLSPQSSIFPHIYVPPNMPSEGASSCPHSSLLCVCVCVVCILVE